MMRRGLIVMMILALSAVSAGRASVAASDAATERALDQEAMLDAATNAYRSALAIENEDPLGARTRYAESAAHYVQLRATGLDSASLHYNLGNAQFKSGTLGAAIASYRRALRRDAGHGNARENLAYARSLVPQQIAGSGGAAFRATVLEAQQRFSPGVRALGLVLMWTIGWGLLALRLSGRGRGGWWWWTTAVVVLIGVLAGASTWSAVSWEPEHPAGVITATEVIARQGDGAGFEPAFLEPLTSGVEFIVQEDRGAWKQIELRDGSRAWVPDNTIEVIRSWSDDVASQ